MDITVCGLPFILPYMIPTILAASTTAGGEAFGMPRLGPIEIGLVNFHSWALLGVLAFAVVTGFGRKAVTSCRRPSRLSDRQARPLCLR